MITPAYSPTATERVLPRMALDFKTGVLDPRVTVARALNTATRVNSSGLIETVNANLPRFDYDAVTLAPKGLLIEEARTNILLYSQQFDDPTNWAKDNSTVTANAAVAPDGTMTADAVIPSTLSSSTHRVRQGVVTVATASSMEIYVKAAGYSKFGFREGGVTGAYGTFNLATGTVIDQGTGGTATIINAGNGWYRCCVSFTAGVTARVDFFPLDNGYTTGSPSGYTFAGDGVSGVLLWGAQLEAGAFATSYIPTTTLAVLRNADTVSMTGTNFSSWFNASEGTLMLQGDTLTIANANSATVANLYLSASNNMRFWLWNGQPSNLRWSVTAAGATSADIAKAVTANTTFKAVGSYKMNKFAYALNGTATTEDVSGNVPSGLTQFFIGSIGGVNEVFSGHIAKINYYPQSLTNSEAQAFST